MEDRLVLSNSSELGNTPETSSRNTLKRFRILYTLLSLIVLILAIDNYQEKHYLQFGISLATFFLFSYAVISSLGNSNSRVIPRKSIEYVVIKKGFSGLTRSRVEVIFKDKSGTKLKRLIPLPGSMGGGSEAAKDALDVLVSNGLIQKS